MACPHGAGAPTMCSQCLGARATKIAVVDGTLVVDGVPGRSLVEINRARYNEETDAGRPQSKKTCGICRTPGHNASTCTRKERGVVEKLLADDDDASAN